MRIVKVNIFRDNAVGPRLYKIDYGTKLELIGTDLPQTYEVHFSKSITEDAYRVLGDASGVVVPDVLLETDGTLYGWLYVHTGADDGWTKRSFMCVVQNRSGVQDVEPPPVQQDIIEQAIAALNAGVEEVHEVVEGVEAAIDAALTEAKESGEFDGPQGPQGPKGDPGETGAKGDPGPQGDPGKDGADGADGKDGQDGAPGQPGADGISPTITITDIPGGHRVTITDVDGQHSFDVMDGDSAEVPVQDVQVNGTSILDAQGVANVPIGSRTALGAVKIETRYYGGVDINSEGGLQLAVVDGGYIKEGRQQRFAITPNNQHMATYYGLAKAAGADMRLVTGDTFGVYPEAQKSAISEMLNGSVSVTGTTPTITALPGIRYVCGEVATLDITLPASGIVDVVFESGSTPTVLTVTPPTGVTVKWANGFDPAQLEANTTYEINVADGLGVAASWT